MAQREEQELIKLNGVVDEVMFKNVQNGYIVLDLDAGNELVTVVGEIGNIDEGEELSLMGFYVNNPKYGRQFRASYCERKLPESEFSILKYLSSGAVKGIGPATAKKIVDVFGTATLDVLENRPEELKKVKGMSAKKIDEISLELQKLFGIRKLMDFLAKMGVPPAVAIRMWKRYGRFAMDVIHENPYSLCDEGIEYPFAKAESIAEKLEISRTDKNRISAGIRYILCENANVGFTCLPTEKLEEIAKRLLEISDVEFYNVLEEEYKEKKLCEYHKKKRVYTFLYEYYRAENYIADRLAAMNDFFKDNEMDYSEVIAAEEENEGIHYQQLQKEAISLALSKGFLILTGGPGTGKTTTLNAIISLFRQHGLTVMIAAPTGRAAKRISDLTGYDAKTIHRLIEVNYDADGNLAFVHHENNLIECDVMVIDEMSMVDTLLFEALLRALPLACKLIMVGDSDQLPSVGAGNLLKDFIESGKITVVSLTEIFRQAKESSIVTNAHLIVDGEYPELTRTDSDFFFMARNTVESAMDTIAQLYKTRLPKAYGYDAVEDIQILSPSRKGMIGSIEINKRIQYEINPPSDEKREIRGLVFTFREGDKVMQTRNNYDIAWNRDGELGAGIFNGDMGRILEVNRMLGAIRIDFDGRIALYNMEMLDQIELAYAVTVHKSQGSEFPAVLLPITVK